MRGTPTTAAPTLSREQVLQIAERCSDLLKTRFGARRVIVFGSAAGQTPWHIGSDLDLAAEGIRPEDFFKAHSALEHLAPPELKVDLVPLEDVYPELRARILGEVEMTDDPILALQGLVKDELISLERVAQNMAMVHAASSDPPDLTEMLAMGALIQQFYNGIDNIFKRIAAQFDGALPTTAHWHKDLLIQMSQAYPSRPAVIDAQLYAWLDDDLDFRHWFSHAYGFQLKWARLYPHVVRLPETFATLRAQLARFFAAVQSEKGRA